MKKFKRLFAALVAAAMMMALCCVSAFAAAPKVTINKNVKSAVAASNTFTFKVEQNTATETANLNTVTIDEVTVTASNTAPGSADINLSKFETNDVPLGFYTYTVSENTPSDTRFTKDDKTYTLNVNKYKDASGNIVVEAKLLESGSTDKKDAVTFTNTFTDKKGLSVTKAVNDKAYENADEAYSITVTLTKADDDDVNTLPPTINATKGTSTVTVGGTVADNGKSATYTFSLKNGETLTLNDIPSGLSYTVTENGVDELKAKNKYFTEVSYTNETGTINDQNISATVTNTYKSKVDTGVLTRIMPFVAMIVAAGAAAAAYFVIARKRRAED